MCDDPLDYPDENEAIGAAEYEGMVFDCSSLDIYLTSVPTQNLIKELEKEPESIKKEDILDCLKAGADVNHRLETGYSLLEKAGMIQRYDLYDMMARSKYVDFSKT